MKIKLYILALLFTSMLYSQAEDKFTIVKSTKEIGLALTYSYQKNKNERASTNPIQHTFAFRPSIGFAIKDNLVIGTQVNLTAVKETIDGNEFERRFAPDVQTYGIGFSPYVKKYFFLGKNLLFNIQGTLGYEYLTQEEYNQNYIIKQYQFDIGVIPGVTFRLSNSLALKGNFGFLGYTNIKTEDPRIGAGTSKQDNFNFNLNASDILVGLVLFIN